jgi:hypothetical protein
MVSIDAGMQIDRSDRQPANALSPRLEMREQRSNVTDTIDRQAQKHSVEIVSMSPEMIKSPPCPKYQIRQVPPKSQRKSPLTPNQPFPASTVTLRISEPASASPVTSRRLAGKQIE